LQQFSYVAMIFEVPCASLESAAWLLVGENVVVLFVCGSVHVLCLCATQGSSPHAAATPGSQAKVGSELLPGSILSSLTVELFGSAVSGV
jgi:hypothetical protein